jgi:hypothetical protein
MAKIEKASQDVVELFDEVRNETSIPNWVMFEVLCNNKQKKDVCKIFKSSDILEVLTEGVNFVVIINEEILDTLPDELKRMAIMECITGVNVSESDSLSLDKHDFNTYTGVLQRYGHEEIIKLHESIKSLYDNKKQKEDEEKAATKGKRGRKAKN